MRPESGETLIRPCRNWQVIDAVDAKHTANDTLFRVNCMSLNASAGRIVRYSRYGQRLTTSCRDNELLHGLMSVHDGNSRL